MKEQRKDPRFKASVSVRYKRTDNPDAHWQTGAEVKNISLGGLMFSAFEKMPVGTPLVFKMQMFTEDSAAKILDVNAFVVAVEDGIVSYDTRATFAWRDNLQQAAFKQFVSYLEK